MGEHPLVWKDIFSGIPGREGEREQSLISDRSRQEPVVCQLDLHSFMEQKA